MGLGVHPNLPPNGISIGSAVFAQLTQHTDTHTTLRATCVGIDNIYVPRVRDATRHLWFVFRSQFNLAHGTD